MYLTILADNYSSLNKKLRAEPGFSVYIEDENDKILFDCGYSSVFAENADILGINLNDLTKVVFSHGHDDHTGGLQYLIPLIKTGIPLIAHPDTFNIKLRGTQPTGSAFREEELAKTFSLSLKREPQKVSEHITFLGEIPETTGFEPRKQFDEKLTPSGRKPDFVMEDSALVYEKPDGIYIISGCSHSGICNITTYAHNLFKKPVLGILGGFHLKEVNEQVQKTISFFRENTIQKIYPCHCTSFEVKSAIHTEIPCPQAVSVGMKTEW